MGMVGRRCCGAWHQEPPGDQPLGVCVSIVLYDGCPKSLKAGVWWPQTKFGFSAAVLCPKGSLGEWGMRWGGEGAA